MFDRLIRFAVSQRWFVMLLTVAAAVMGGYSYLKLPIDAVPDITNVQVQVNTAAPGYSPLETEQRITYPIETAMAGIPGLEETRSISRYGLSQVTVVFKEHVDIYFARQLVNERIQHARESLPPGITPSMGPTSTGLGEIYMWTVEAEPGALKADGTPYSPMDLREIQDWVVKPQLRNVAGVNEINTIGGFAKQYQVSPLPDRLVAHGLSMADVVSALQRNNANVGAGYIEKSGEQYLIRIPGQVRNLDEIGNIVVSARQGVPVRIRDIADVGFGQELRSGAASENGEEVVIGTVFMLIGENSREVSAAVDKRLAEINKTLPKGIVTKTVYDRTALIDKAIDTVRKNLVEGALLVVAVLFVFLGNIRAAVITMLVIPLSMLLTFTGMLGSKVSANLMSLGALDFGIIIDGAVVIVENCIRHMAHAQSRLGRPLSREERFAEVFAAAKEARRPLVYGQLIIMIVYLPIFALTGTEGKMFHPMAFTVLTALLAAMVLSVTFIPAAVALFITGSVQEKESRVLHGMKQRYPDMLRWTLANRAIVLTAAALAIALGGLMASRIGSEFMPNLNEGDILVQSIRMPGTSLSQSMAMQREIEHTIMQFKEVERVFSKVGTAEIASDPMPPSAADTYVMLKPKSAWPDPRLSKRALIARIQHAVELVPGSNYEITQPIQMRFNELISGVRSDVAVKVFGDEMGVMQNTAGQIASVLRRIPGAEDVKVEQTSGLPILTIQIDREKIARLGINVDDVQQTMATALNGQAAGYVFQGDRRFDLTVRLPEHIRVDIEAIKRLPIRLPDLAARNYLPLSELAEIDVAPAPNQFSRENGKRRIVVTANVRGRDIGSFVQQAQRQIEQDVEVPPAYWLVWGGTFEQLQSATQRLAVVIPVALLLVMALLYAMFGNMRDGLIVFTGIPFALTGGILALWLRGIPLSVSAGVGFIALSGVAVLNGLVLISFIRGLREAGAPLLNAIEDGVVTRLRPVLMTALVASLGFIPMAIATGIGAEVQRPLATVVIGGILSSTILTLLVLPLLYWIVNHREEVQP
ncbi:efflux RND transporter permease subunit [Methylobacillus pratensis]